MNEYDKEYAAQIAYVQTMIQQMLDKTPPGAAFDALDAILEFCANERDAKGDET
jgi:hypothetical protein